MTEIAAFLEKNDQIRGRYELLTVSHPKIEEKYGTISIVKITLDITINKPIIYIPGYSNESFETGFNILMENFYHYKHKYSVLYAVCWGSTIKKESAAYSKDAKNQEEEYTLNEDFRIKLANILDKIIRSPSMDIHNITVIAKSAGAGVGIHLASFNDRIRKLYIACPGTNDYGQALENRKDLPILMMWNKDDNKLDYNIYKEFIKTFEKNGNDYKFYSYDTGGHDFNYDFIELL